MSIFSDYKVGALTDEEFKAEGIRMNNRDKYESALEFFGESHWELGLEDISNEKGDDDA